MSQTFLVRVQENRSIAEGTCRRRGGADGRPRSGSNWLHGNIGRIPVGRDAAPAPERQRNIVLVKTRKNPFFAVNILRTDHQTVADQFAGCGGLHGMVESAQQE